MKMIFIIGYRIKGVYIPAQRISPELDYDKYATGESMLAWLDQKVYIHTKEPVAVKADFQTLLRNILLPHFSRCLNWKTLHEIGESLFVKIHFQE